MNFFQYTLSTLFCLLSFGLSAQNNGVGIGTTAPDPSAILHVESTTQGVLLPRMNDSQESAISGPLNGLLYFNTTDSVFKYRRGAGYSSLLFRGHDGRIDLELLGAAGETAKSVIDFGQNGDTPPDQLDGWKIRLWGGGPLTNGDDYGFGIAPGRLWSAAASGADFGWYIGNNERMVLNNSGRLFTHNGFESNGSIYSGNRIQSAGGFLADGGAPGPGGNLNNGYAFGSGNGDNDSGMYSSTDGHIDFYTDSQKRVTVNNAGQTTQGSITATQNIQANQNLTVAGQANLNGNVRIDGDYPIKIERYTNLGDDISHDTGYSTADWNAVIAGFQANDGDIQEDNAGRIIQMKMVKIGGSWYIWADFRTHNNNESWDVDVMFIRTSMSQSIGF